MTHDPCPSSPLAVLDRLRGANLPLTSIGSEGIWSPDLSLPPSLWELFASSDEASADRLALAFGQQLARCDGEPWLWVQDRESSRLAGRPYLHGIAPPLRPGLLHVIACTAADALWAMEEGVRCRALQFVVGELTGDPKSLDFTASRRLVLAAERSGVPLILIRREAAPNLSAARLRWRVASGASAPHRWNSRAPGNPVVSAKLFRARGLHPGTFMLSYGGERERQDTAGTRDRLDLVAPFRDRPVEPDLREAG